MGSNALQVTHNMYLSTFLEEFLLFKLLSVGSTYTLTKFLLTQYIMALEGMATILWVPNQFAILCVFLQCL